MEPAINKANKYTGGMYSAWELPEVSREALLSASEAAPVLVSSIKWDEWDLPSYPIHFWVEEVNSLLSGFSLSSTE